MLQQPAFSQNFDKLTSQLFFDANLKRPDTTLIAYFHARQELAPVKQTGWTAYPPSDNNGRPLPFQLFSFTTHPYFSAVFTDGGLTVITSQHADSVVGISLSLSFSSPRLFDSTYQSIRELYSKCAAQVIRRPNIAQPFEVTKYLSKTGNDYVIVTKGEGDKKPYIHIAYNHQDYNW